MTNNFRLKFDDENPVDASPGSRFNGKALLLWGTGAISFFILISVVSSLLSPEQETVVIDSPKLELEEASVEPEFAPEELEVEPKRQVTRSRSLQLTSQIKVSEIETKLREQRAVLWRQDARAKCRTDSNCRHSGELLLQTHKVLVAELKKLADELSIGTEEGATQIPVISAENTAQIKKYRDLVASILDVQEAIALGTNLPEEYNSVSILEVIDGFDQMQGQMNFRKTSEELRRGMER